MAFADPQPVTINSVLTNLPRVQTDGLMSVYMSADGTLKLTVSHQVQNDGRVRSMGRLDQTKVATDPISSANKSVTLSIYTVIERPSFGFSSTEVDQLATGYKSWLSSTVIGKLYGKES